MLIKYQALEPTLSKQSHALYVLTGTDPYLLNHAASSIKATWRQKGDIDEKKLQLNTSADWTLLIEEANHYSLFAEHVLLDAHYEKKTLESAGKKSLQIYLENMHARCVLLLRAENIPQNQLAWLAKHDHVLLIQAYPLADAALKNWIKAQLQSHAIRFEPQVPDLIQYYTQGNMLACAQVIEKIALVYDQEVLSVDKTKEQLTVQCDYQLFELADACLNAQAEKALYVLQQASQNQTEPTLVLWLLTQEVRLLIQLSQLAKQQAIPLAKACQQLKIWPHRLRLYETALKRLSSEYLYQLLIKCQQCDEQIKSNQSAFIWHSLQQLALMLTLHSV
jgi:DNA polymerase-3 subunit delta